MAIVVDGDVTSALAHTGYTGAGASPQEHAEAWVTDLLAYLNTPYRRDLDLSLTISHLEIYTQPGEPWTQWTNDPDRRVLSPTATHIFRTAWNQHRSHIRRDVALILNAPDTNITPDDIPRDWNLPAQCLQSQQALLSCLGGGHAYDIGVVCDTSQAYASTKVPNFGFPVATGSRHNSQLGTNDGYFGIAHEIGHLLGGYHTFDFGINPAFTNPADTWSVDGKTEVIDGCLGGVGQNFGTSTIMSYCEDRIDGFHPRNAAVIRQVVATAACLEPLPFPTLETLTNGAAVAGLNVDNQYARRFTLGVPSQAQDLVVQTFHGSGQVELYLIKDFAIVGHSNRQGTHQSVSVPTPEGGTWYVWLHGAPAFQQVTLEATF